MEAEKSVEAITASPEEPKVMGNGIKRIFRNENFKKSTIEYNIGLISHTAGGIDDKNLATIYDSHTRIISALVESIPEEKESLFNEKILAEASEFITITVHNKPVEEVKKIRAEKSKNYRNKVKDMTPLERSLYIINNACDREVIKLDKKGRKVKFHVSVEYLEGNISETEDPSENTLANNTRRENLKEELSDEEGTINEDTKDEIPRPEKVLVMKRSKDEISEPVILAKCSKDEILDEEEMSMNEFSNESMEEEESMNEISDEEESMDEFSDEEESMEEISKPVAVKNSKSEISKSVAVMKSSEEIVSEPPKVDTKKMPTVGGKRSFPSNPSPGLVGDLEASLKEKLETVDNSKKIRETLAISIFIASIRKKDFLSAMRLYEQNDILKEAKYDFTELFSKNLTDSTKESK